MVEELNIAPTKCESKDNRADSGTKMVPGQAGIDARLLLAAPMKLLGMTCSEVLSMEAVDRGFCKEAISFGLTWPPDCKSVHFAWDPTTTPWEQGGYSQDLQIGDGEFSYRIMNGLLPLGEGSGAEW